LQLTTKVKQAGLFLDKGLTWKVQQQSVINKTYRAFWTCKSTFGKTFSLKSRVVHWIYTMVFRTILIYGSMVWWQRVRYNIRKTEFSKLQRLACLAVTWAIQMPPTAEKEVLLNFLLSSDNWGIGPVRDLQTNVYTTVEI
jgi:hypothetical protein